MRLSIEGDFGTPRLARLEPEDQQLIESFLLAGGNLKSLAENLSLSYPTLRKRLDAMINRLAELKAGDHQRNEQLLRKVESGDISPEMAARLMKETAHG